MAKIPVGVQLVWGPGYGVKVWEWANNFHQIVCGISCTLRVEDPQWTQESHFSGGEIQSRLFRRYKLSSLLGVVPQFPYLESGFVGGRQSRSLPALWQYARSWGISPS